MDLVYRTGRLFGRFAFFCTMRSHVLNRDHANRAGPYVLALTHLSHLEPLCAGILMRRRIDWMTRKEFFKYRPIAWVLRRMNAFLVNRQGIPVSAIRTAIERLRRGRVVGICPEGGVCTGAASALRGAAIKRGFASVAIRAGVPVVPCAMVGTDKLNRIGPWMPAKRARIWVAFGEPIHPPTGVKSTRATRAELTRRLSAAYVELYAKIREQYGIADSDVG
jgi:1-acyl-sn-glycerol-3-phosphate acyltransferase